MAVIINNRPSIEDQIGTGLGQGISQGVQQLLSNKMQEMLKHQQHGKISGALKALNIPNADQLAALDPAILSKIIDYQQKAPERQAYGDTIRNLLGGQSTGSEEANITSQVGGTTPTSGNTGGSFNLPKGAELSGKSVKEIADLKLKQDANQLKAQKNEREVAKEYREFSKPYIERRKAFEKDERDYKGLIKLAPTLRAGSNQQLLEKLGLGDFYRPYTNEVAQKIIARLAQNVNGVFGSNSRVTNFLEQTFQRSLPTLWNTPEGIVAISELNLLAGEGAKVEDDIRKELTKKYGYNLPANVQDEIDELAKPKLDELQEKTIQKIEEVIDKQSGNKKGTPLVKSLKEAVGSGSPYIQDEKTGKIFQIKDGQAIPVEGY